MDPTAKQLFDEVAILSRRANTLQFEKYDTSSEDI